MLASHVAHTSTIVGKWQSNLVRIAVYTRILFLAFPHLPLPDARFDANGTEIIEEKQQQQQHLLLFLIVHHFHLRSSVLNAEPIQPLAI